MSARPRMSRATAGAALAVLALLAGCATAPPPPPPAGPLGLDEASRHAADHAARALLARRGVPGFWAAQWPRTWLIAPATDGRTREQTAATVRVREQALAALRAGHPSVVALPPGTGAGAAEVADHRLDLVLTPLPSPAPDGPTHRLAARLIEVASGAVVAESDLAVRDTSAAADATPTAFHQASPVTMGRGAAPSSEAAGGTDAGRVARARTRAIAALDEAGAVLAAGDAARALRLYRAAAAMPEVDALAARVGAYLAATRLGDEAGGRAAFADIVRVGLAQGMLGVKLLFAPGATTFWPDPAISGAYPSWLDEIARQAREGRRCLQVVGHASRSGGEAYNLALSAQRAEAVRARLVSGGPLAVEVSGRGWQDNLVGTGTDDLRDAVDRRVEFRAADCPAGGG